MNDARLELMYKCLTINDWIDIRMPSYASQAIKLIRDFIDEIENIPGIDNWVIRSDFISYLYRCVDSDIEDALCLVDKYSSYSDLWVLDRIEEYKKICPDIPSAKKAVIDFTEMFEQQG